MSQAQAVARPSVRWRLGGRTRKGVLLVHIAAAGVWLGIDVVMGVLVFTALLGAAFVPPEQEPGDQAAPALHQDRLPPLDR